MSKHIIYTKPESEVRYKPRNGWAPDVHELIKPREQMNYVGQGQGLVSADGTPSYSEGFAKCSALILKIQGTNNSALYHLDDWDFPVEERSKSFKQLIEIYLNSLNLPKGKKDLLSETANEILGCRRPEKMSYDEFAGEMQALNPDGVFRGQFIFGSESRRLSKIVYNEFLSQFGIKINKDIFVDSGRYHWGLLYKPTESEILTYTSHKYKLRKFPFKFGSNQRRKNRYFSALTAAYSFLLKNNFFV
jgi:hypothetical protein